MRRIIKSFFRVMVLAFLFIECNTAKSSVEKAVPSAMANTFDSNDSLTVMPEADSVAVEMYLNPSVIAFSQNQITVTIHNKSDSTLLSSFYQKVYYLNDSIWEVLKYKEKYMLLESAQLYRPNMSVDFIESLDLYQFNFVPGKYKIRKELDVLDSKVLNEKNKLKRIKKIVLEKEFFIQPDAEK